MESVFLKLVNMSITASYLILAVIAFRLVLIKAPKYIRCILWGLVALRLICPVSVESVLSLIPNEEPLPQEFLYAAEPQINTGIPYVNNSLNPVIAESLAPAEAASANPTQIWSFVLSRVWIIGMALMLLYAAVSYLRIRRKTQVSIPVGKNIRLCDHIGSPFILGILRPKIYLPSELDQNTIDQVLAHENAHLGRKDHWWKPLGYLLLTVYWFNPLIWIAYILLCRDIELACDERVVKSMDTEEKKAYSSALLRCSMPRHMIAACPLAFGEGNVKGRIQSVLHYKKPAFWIILVAVLASVVVGVCFLTDPPEDTDPAYDSIMDAILTEDGYTILGQEILDIQIRIPKSALPDSIYSEEGQTFSPEQIIVYQSESTTFYLSEVRFANEGDDKLYFTFDSLYTPPESGTLTLIYKTNDDGSTTSAWVTDKTLTDDATAYPDAVSYRGDSQGTSFTVYVDTEICRSAVGSLNFTVSGFAEVAYCMDGAKLLPSGVYDIGTLAGQHIALSYRPEEGDGQIILDGNTLTVITDDGAVRYTGSDPVFTSNSWDNISSHLTQDEGLGLYVSFISSLEETVSMDIYEYLEDGEPRYTIYCTQGTPNLLYDSHRLYVLEEIDTSNRLSPGVYIPVECIYMNPASSYYPGDLSSDYRYIVTDQGFYTDSRYYICNADVENVDWGWKTIAEAAEELKFLLEWMDSDWAGIGGVPLSLSAGTLYQRLDAQTHLLLVEGNLYILHGSRTARNEIETVWGIYRLVPESEVPDTDGQNVTQGEDVVTNIDLSDFLTEGNAITTTLDLSDGSFESNGAHLYMNLTSGAIYDSRSTLDKAIKEAILENHGGSNSENTLYAESHTILSQLVACGAYTGEGVGPCGYTTVYAIAHVEEIAAAPETRTMSEWSYPVVISFDEYTDGTYHLTEYCEPGEATFDADVRSKFPDDSTEQALNYASSLSALKNHCTYQAILYFGQDCTNLIESLIGEICSTPLYMSSIAPYIETYPVEYALLTALGEDTLRYCFDAFNREDYNVYEAELMAAVCRDIAEGWGEDISFDGQYFNATDWFRILRENAADREQALLEKLLTAEELAKNDPCMLILLQVLAE